MGTLAEQEKGTPETTSAFGRLDKIFDEWFRALPLRRPFGLKWEEPEDLIRVDEYRDGETLVIRAELPGIDPEKDVSLTAAEGVLQIKAERKVEKETEDKGYTRHEIHYGALTRTLPLPAGVTETDIVATYDKGILEIRVPIPAEPTAKTPTTIPITKA